MTQAMPTPSPEFTAQTAAPQQPVMAPVVPFPSQSPQQPVSIGQPVYQPQGQTYQQQQPISPMAGGWVNNSAPAQPAPVVQMPLASQPQAPWVTPSISPQTSSPAYTAPSNVTVPAVGGANEPAGYAELAQHYGSVENAAYHSNIKALQAEGALGQAAQGLNQMTQYVAENFYKPVLEWGAARYGQQVPIEQIPQALNTALNEHGQMRQLLLDPNRLAGYFTAMNDADLASKGLPKMSENLDWYKAQMSQDQQLPAQQQVVGQPIGRPTFPGGAAPVDPGAAAPQGRIADQGWRALDQLSPEQWRQMRVVFPT